MPQGVPDPTTITTRQGFAHALTELRERAGLTVREAARAAGMQASTAGGYFGGRHLPPIGNPGVLIGLLSACGVEQTVDQDAWREALLRVRRTPTQRSASAAAPGSPGGSPDGTPDRSRASSGTSAEPRVPAPYRGLATFQPEDAEWFFGREELTDALVSRVAAAARRLAVGTAHGLVVVVGASGSGKSSLLRAGLIPALERGAISAEPWSWLLLTPGPDPSAELEHRLDADTTPDADLVVVVDQFEELFTAGGGDEPRRAFVNRLLTLSQERIGRTVVVAGLRADFYGHATRLPGMVPALQDAQLVVGPMNATQLRRAITGPARRARVELEDGLVNMVLAAAAPTPVGSSPGWTSAAAHDPGALPLLSHALLATWQRGPGSALRIADYVATGGISGAVAGTADEVYRGLTLEQQDAAHRLFRRLVSVSETAADARRRVTFAELGPPAEDPASPLRVAMDELVRHRLLTTELDGIEISHDALLTAWPRLRSWVNADRVGLGTHRQLTEAALAWDNGGRDAQSLYRGNRLVAALDWAAEPDRAGELAPVERAFLDDGRSVAEAERRSQQRITRRLRWLVGSLAALLVVVAGLAGYAFHLQSGAAHDRDLATSRQLAGQADRLRPDDVSVAAQLSVLAQRTAGTSQARSAVLDSAAAPLATRLFGPAGVLHSVSVAAKGNLVAGAGEKGAVRLWRVPPDGRPQRLADLPSGGDATLFATAFSPDGRTLAAAGADHRVRLWDVGTPNHPTPLPAPANPPADTVYALAFSPDGTVLAAGSADRTVRLWDLHDRRAPVPLPTIAGPTDAVQAVAFSPDGKLLASAGADRLVRLWNVADPAHPVPSGGGAGVRLSGAASTVFGVAFAPDGRSVAGSTRDGTVLLWDLARIPRSWPRGATPALAPARTLTGPTNWVNGVAFSPDGAQLAAASSDGRVWIWDSAGGTLRASLPHPAPVTGVAWRGSELFTSSADGTARRWSLPASPATGLPAAVFSVTFSRDGKRLAAGASGQAGLWNVTDPARPQPLGPGVSGDATARPARGAPAPAPLDGASALSPDGNLLAAGTKGGSVLFWDVTDPTRPKQLAGPLAVSGQLVEWMTFSPDGNTLAIGSDDSTARLVDVHDRAHPAVAGPPLTGPGNLVLCVAFSADGKTLAAATANRTVWLWNVSDVQSPKPVGGPLHGPSSYVYGVAFSPDGKTLAAGTADHSVWLWDLADRAHPAPIGRPLIGPSNDVSSVAFSPDGRLLAAGAGDHSVWLWDVADRAAPSVRATLTDAGGPVYAVGFSPDGGTLAAGSQDHQVWLWPVDAERAATRICASAGDGLTRQEWDLFVPGLPYHPAC